MIISENHIMKKHSSMRIGGVAKSFIEIESKEELFPPVSYTHLTLPTNSRV